MFGNTYMINCYLQIRISDDKMRQLEEEAMRQGMTKSELIRHLIAKFPEPFDGGSIRSPFIPTPLPPVDGVQRGGGVGFQGFFCKFF